MPIMLDDLNQAAVAKSYSPRFFDAKLTGSGKNTGLLQPHRNPAHIKDSVNTPADIVSCRHHHTINNGETTTFIPTYTVPADAWSLVNDVNIPDTADMVKIAENGDIDLYIAMDIHAMILVETKDENNLSQRDLRVAYQLKAICVNSTGKPMNSPVDSDERVAVCQNKRLATHAHASAPSPGWIRHAAAKPTADFAEAHVNITCDPRATIEAYLSYASGLGWKTFAKDALQWFADYDLYTALCRRSEEWQTKIAVHLDWLFANLGGAYANSNWRSVIEGLVVDQLHAIEDYKIPLELYRDIYDSIYAHFPDDMAEQFCKENLSLLLSDTLRKLDDDKPNLEKIPPTNAKADAFFSPEQKAAIESDEPLILVQSGAGSGKSSVVIARIKQMEAAGIDPNDIMVLSFTNAAADHITELYPNVHSMTIASMVHTIYDHNFPEHQLSTIHTLMNSIDITYGRLDETATELRRCLMMLAKQAPNAVVDASNFIEDNYDKVMEILTTLGQTTLELEIIIAYQQIDNLVEPESIQSRHLIIDEVQDNSIFEFIYTLKYTAKHKESLFMVGDCAQTLFEFRASNPRALNVLEGSGVFATYKLQTNFRSNQEVLDFANVLLAKIEANQYARIQLQANNLSPVTEKSFTDRVRLHYDRANRVRDYENELELPLAGSVKPYIDECLAKGEQVAFIAYKRASVAKMKEFLERNYPTREIADITPERPWDATTFSTFVKLFWDEVAFAPTNQPIDFFIQEKIRSEIGRLAKNPDTALPNVMETVERWRRENGADIAMWQQHYLAGTITQAEFLDEVKNCMINFEITNNAVRTSMIAKNNKEAKLRQQDIQADFIVSTIHSAKGLEFDNTVVLYKDHADDDEETKRMYYVAFTRAKKSEFVLAYGLKAKPKIQLDYTAITETLHERDLIRAGAAQNND